MAGLSNHVNRISTILLIALASLVFFVYMLTGNSIPQKWLLKEPSIASNGECCPCKTEVNISRSYNNTDTNYVDTPLSTVDFEAPCDVRSVITSMYDTQKPLTSSDIALLRGCTVLLFFRNPRCATTSIYFLMNELSKTLGFESLLRNPMTQNSKLENWVDFVNNATKSHRPIVVSPHSAALDIISSATKPPVIFNLNRHPIDHLVSIFKLQKYGDRARDDSRRSVNKVQCNISFDDYIMTRGLRNPCIKESYMGLRYLCGSCQKCTREMCLNQAKRNLDSIYLVVGISENIPAFLFVMETILPPFFHGALEKYVHMSGLYQMFRADPGRDEPLHNDTVRYLQDVLAPDIELYHYVKARFYTALKKVLEYRADNNLTDAAQLYHRKRPRRAKQRIYAWQKAG